MIESPNWRNIKESHEVSDGHKRAIDHLLTNQIRSTPNMEMFSLKYRAFLLWDMNIDHILSLPKKKKKISHLDIYYCEKNMLNCCINDFQVFLPQSPGLSNNNKNTTILSQLFWSFSLHICKIGKLNDNLESHVKTELIPVKHFKGAFSKYNTC